MRYVRQSLFSSMWGVLVLGIDFARCQDTGLTTAVDACIQESSTGDCKCENGCGSYNGPIGEWDVSKVTDMKSLFYTWLSNKCTKYCDFNADISKWDTSRVTTMYAMWVSVFHSIDTELG